MFNRVSSLAFISAFFLLVGCNNGDKDSVVASINGLSISETQFVNAFRYYYKTTGAAIEPNFVTKKAVLDSEFRTFVLATNALDRGMADYPHVQQYEGIIQRKILVDEYLEEALLDSIEIKEADVRDVFLRFNTQLRASHLFSRDKNEIEDLYRRLEEGESFEKLAKETFQNTYLKENGGDIGLFSIDEMDIAFEDAAFSLKVGEISSPVKTAQGYSIVKLTHRSTLPVLTENQFNSTKNRMVTFAEKRAVEKAKRAHLNSFLAALTLDEQKLLAIWNVIEQQNYSFDVSNPESPLSELFSENETLVSGDVTTLQYGEFLTETYFTPHETVAPIHTFSGFKKFVQGLAYRNHLLKLAQQEGIQEKEEIKEDIKWNVLTYLSRQVVDSLEANIEVSPSEALEEYSRAPYQYELPLKMNFMLIEVSDEAIANRIKKEADRGVDFISLLRTYTLNGESLLNDGITGLKPIAKYGFAGTRLKSLQVGEVSDVLEYQKGTYHVYKCLERVEAEPATFAQARERVERVVAQRKLKEQTNQLINRTKEKHRAFIDLEKLKHIDIKL